MMSKRLFDLGFSAVAIFLLSPLLVGAAMAVWWLAGRPILFCQDRVGQDGKEFKMYKFRSMVNNASSIGPYHTEIGDFRITPVGRFLRRTSLDELPQLFNVLLGDMSLVGPRPDLPEQKKLYSNREWATRCSVKPGITGLAQATIRSDCTFEERKVLDLEYAENHTLFLDFKILNLTLLQIIQPKGN